MVALTMFLCFPGTKMLEYVIEWVGQLCPNNNNYIEFRIAWKRCTEQSALELVTEMCTLELANYIFMNLLSTTD